MTSSVTAPLERQFGQMPGLNQMTSASSGGASVITLQFSLDLTLDVAEQEVQAAINASGNLLPADLPTPPIYAKVNPADAPILTLSVTSKTLALTDLEDLSETRLAQKISQLTGVGLVSVSGGQRPAVRIQLNPQSLAAYGLNIDDVRTTLGNLNVNTPKGNFDGPTQASDHQRQRPGHQRRAIPHPDRRLSQRRAGPALGRRHHRQRPGKHQARRLGQYDAGDHHQCAASARRQYHPGRRPHPSSCCRRSPPRCRRRSTSPCSATAPSRSAPRSRTSSSNWRSPSCWSCW